MARPYRTCSIERLEKRALFAAYIAGSSNVYASIQAAVDAALAGQTINVDPGNYAEVVTVNKPLTLRGAQAGVDGRSNRRGVNETIIVGAKDPNSANNISTIYVNADGVTVDGFVVQGNSSNGRLGAGIVIAPNRAGTTVINNILRDNVAGLFLSNNSATQPAVIRNNLFFNNNLEGDHSGRGIYTNGGFTGGLLQNVTIDSNAFIHHYGSPNTTTTLEAAISLQTLAPNSQKNIRITNNMFDSNGKAGLFYNTSDLLIEGNLITWAKDQWSAALRFEGGNSNVAIRGNTMFANPGNVVRIDNKAVPGAQSGVSITGNNIYMNGLNTTTKASIVVDAGTYTGPLDATNNFWGSAAGPGNAIIANGNNVISSPFATTRFNHPLETAYRGTPWATDGIIQIEDFDHGGQGITFHDVETANLGQAKYRQPWGVDIQTTTDAGGGYNIGYVKAGEWLQYTIDVQQAGTYHLDVRVAFTTSGGKFHFELNGVNLTGPMTMPNTGGTQVWKTITKSGVTLPAGRHTLRLVMDANSSSGSVGNFNWFRFRADVPLVLPPAAPTNLATPQSVTTSVPLTWSDNSDNETGFIVERRLSDGDWSVIATVPVNSTTLTDTTVAGGKSYVYRVRAYNSGGESANSNEAGAIIPVQPVYLSDLAWTSAVNGYGPVERDTGNGGSDVGDGPPITLNGVVYAKGLGVHANSEVVYNLAGQYATFLSDVGVDDRQTTSGSVIFRVFADDVLLFDSGVMGPASATQSINLNVTGVQTLRLVVTDAGDGSAFDHADWAGARLIPSSDPPVPPPSAPATPANFSAVAVSQTQINLTWSDVADETSYIIERSTDGVNFSPLATVAAQGTSYSDITAVASTQYTYRIRAANSAGESANATATATTPAAPTAPAAPNNLSAAAISSDRIDLVWSDNANNETGYKIERSIDGVNFTPLFTTSANITNYSDTAGLSASTRYWYRVRATNAVGDSGDSNIASATTSPTSSLPAGWFAGDVGPVGLAGSTSVSGNTWTLKGAGADIWGNSDSFHFAYRQITGDFTIVTRVASMTNTDLNAKAGIMVRESLAANSRQASAVVTPGGGIKFLRRTSTGGSTTATTVSNLKAPYWLKLVRSGSTITTYYSANGTSWTTLASQSISMSSTVYVGLAVTSKKTATLATATFENVSVS